MFNRVSFLCTCSLKGKSAVDELETKVNDCTNLGEGVVVTFSRVGINRVWLPILLVVS